jgi:hypothetical protein
MDCPWRRLHFHLITNLKVVNRSFDRTPRRLRSIDPNDAGADLSINTMAPVAVKLTANESGSDDKNPGGEKRPAQEINFWRGV